MVSFICADGRAGAAASRVIPATSALPFLLPSCPRRAGLIGVVMAPRPSRVGHCPDQGARCRASGGLKTSRCARQAGRIPCSAGIVYAIGSASRTMVAILEETSHAAPACSSRGEGDLARTPPLGPFASAAGGGAAAARRAAAAPVLITAEITAKRSAADASEHRLHWNAGAPISSSSVGTVREELSHDATAWHYFPHNMRSLRPTLERGGLAALRRLNGCFAWRLERRDPILKEGSPPDRPQAIMART